MAESSGGFFLECGVSQSITCADICASEAELVCAAAASELIWCFFFCSRETPPPDASTAPVLRFQNEAAILTSCGAWEARAGGQAGVSQQGGLRASVAAAETTGARLGSARQDFWYSGRQDFWLAHGCVC